MAGKPTLGWNSSTHFQKLLCLPGKISLLKSNQKLEHPLKRSYFIQEELKCLTAAPRLRVRIPVCVRMLKKKSNQIVYEKQNKQTRNKTFTLIAATNRVKKLQDKKKRNEFLAQSSSIRICCVRQYFVGCAQDYSKYYRHTHWDCWLFLLLEACMCVLSTHLMEMHRAHQGLTQALTVDVLWYNTAAPVNPLVAKTLQLDRNEIVNSVMCVYIFFASGIHTSHVFLHLSCLSVSRSSYT